MQFNEMIPMIKDASLMFITVKNDTSKVSTIIEEIDILTGEDGWYEIIGLNDTSFSVKGDREFSFEEGLFLSDDVVISLG